MSDEIPFKFVRYQNTDGGVFDVAKDCYISSSECAKRLNMYIVRVEVLEEYRNHCLELEKKVEELEEELRLALN